MSTELEKYRKTLIPKWIKVFGWIFLVMGCMIPLIPIISPLLNQPASYEIFGLKYQGSPFAPMAILISTIVLSLSVSAYGLLFGKNWGVNACLITGYLGMAICIFTMVYYGVTEHLIEFRLELLLQIPYVRKLHKIRTDWLRGYPAI